MRLYVGAKPTSWIAEWDDMLWEFPGENNGWARRSLYRGTRAELREVGAYNAAGTGWPGSRIPADDSTGSA